MPLHPQARAFLDAVAAQKAPGWEQMPPTEGRHVFDGLTDLFGKGPELHEIEDRTIAGQLVIRIYRPSPARPLPAVLFFHGGGWVLGSIETHDTLCRRLAKGSGCIFISVSYRRAPEYPFPAALLDCAAATRYVVEHVENFGIDTRRVAVCGDSAGGNLAAAVAVKALIEDGPRLHSQWLLYPAIAADFETISYRTFAEGYGLTRANMQWFWNQYAPSPVDRTDPLVSPGCAKSLLRLPPAHVITAEYDVLRDEGEEYARRLRAAGVAVTARRYDGMLHGFMHFAEPFDDARRAVAELAQDMKLALNPSSITP